MKRIGCLIAALSLLMTLSACHTGGEAEQRYRNFVNIAANSCSASERRADEAERAVDDLYKVWYMRSHIGETFEGLISGVTAFGVFGVDASTEFAMRLPEEFREMVLEIIDAASRASRGATVLFVLTVFWSGSSLFSHMLKDGELLYGEKRGKSGVIRKLLSFFLLFLLFLMFFLHNPDNSAQRCFQIRIGNRF